jgi:hypothetical protein
MAPYLLILPLLLGCLIPALAPAWGAGKFLLRGQPIEGKSAYAVFTRREGSFRISVPSTEAKGLGNLSTIFALRKHRK